MLELDVRRVALIWRVMMNPRDIKMEDISTCFLTLLWLCLTCLISMCSKLQLTTRLRSEILILICTMTMRYHWRVACEMLLFKIKPMTKLAKGLVEGVANGNNGGRQRGVIYGSSAT